MGLWDSRKDNVFEILGTRNWTWAETEQGIQVNVFVPYSESHSLVKNLITFREGTPDFVNPALFTNLPLDLISATIKPLVVSGRAFFPDEDHYPYNDIDAVVTLQYSSFTHRNRNESEDFAEDYFETYEPFAENQVLDFNLFYWGTKPTNVKIDAKEAPARQWISGTYTVYWYNQEEVPDEYFDLIGSVNTLSHRAIVVNKVFQAEQMLYFPAGYSKSLFWRNTETFTIDRGFNYVCKWLVKTQEGDDDEPTWNKYYRQETGTVADEGGSPSEDSVGPIFDTIKRKSDDTVYNNFPKKDHEPLLPS